MKLGIVHFQPLEYYPPVTNLLNYLSEKDQVNVTVYTTRNNKQRVPYENKELKIFRSSLPFPAENAISKLYKYWTFNVATFLRLILLKPEAILYYESYSAFPVYIYSRFFNKNIKIYVHFHEYFSKEWYARGMKLVRKYHALEKNYLWHKAIWISQTNKDRVRLFLTDHPEVSPSKMKVMPNYPPKSWATRPVKKGFDKIRCVYIGSLSLQSTFIKEFCTWVVNYPDAISLDVYSYNIYQDAKDYLLSLNAVNFRFFETGIEYEQIPALLDQYNVGLILYKANTLNYVYNETNKLFEYLSRGLDVWFPKEVKGIYSYATRNCSPKVTKIDFQNLDQSLIEETLYRENLTYKSFTLTCDRVYDKLMDHLLTPESNMARNER